MHLFKYENLTKKTDLVKRVWSEIIHIGVERKREKKYYTNAGHLRVLSGVI